MALVLVSIKKMVPPGQTKTSMEGYRQCLSCLGKRGFSSANPGGSGRGIFSPIHGEVSDGEAFGEGELRRSAAVFQRFGILWEVASHVGNSESSYGGI